MNRNTKKNVISFYMCQIRPDDKRQKKKFWASQCSLDMTQLFWARIKDNKAISRYKNFRSAAPAQLSRYNQNKDCSETSIP